MGQLHLESIEPEYADRMVADMHDRYFAAAGRPMAGYTPGTLTTYSSASWKIDTADAGFKMEQQGMEFHDPAVLEPDFSMRYVPLSVESRDSRLGKFLLTKDNGGGRLLALTGGAPPNLTEEEALALAKANNPAELAGFLKESVRAGHLAEYEHRRGVAMFFSGVVAAGEVATPQADGGWKTIRDLQADGRHLTDPLFEMWAIIDPARHKYADVRYLDTRPQAIQPRALTAERFNEAMEYLASGLGHLAYYNRTYERRRRMRM